MKIQKESVGPDKKEKQDSVIIDKDSEEKNKLDIRCKELRIGNKDFYSSPNLELENIEFNNPRTNISQSTSQIFAAGKSRFSNIGLWGTGFKGFENRARNSRAKLSVANGFISKPIIAEYLRIPERRTSRIFPRRQSEFLIRNQSEEESLGRRIQKFRRNKSASYQSRDQLPPIPENVLEMINLFQKDSLLKMANRYYKPGN